MLLAKLFLIVSMVLSVYGKKVNAIESNSKEDLSKRSSTSSSSSSSLTSSSDLSLPSSSSSSSSHEPSSLQMANRLPTLLECARSHEKAYILALANQSAVPTDVLLKGYMEILNIVRDIDDLQHITSLTLSKIDGENLSILKPLVIQAFQQKHSYITQQSALQNKLEYILSNLPHHEESPAKIDVATIQTEGWVARQRPSYMAPSAFEFDATEDHKVLAQLAQLAMTNMIRKKSTQKGNVVTGCIDVIFKGKDGGKYNRVTIKIDDLVFSSGWESWDMPDKTVLNWDGRSQNFHGNDSLLIATLEAKEEQSITLPKHITDIFQKAKDLKLDTRKTTKNPQASDNTHKRNEARSLFYHAEGVFMQYICSHKIMEQIKGKIPDNHTLTAVVVHMHTYYESCEVCSGIIYKNLQVLRGNLDNVFVNVFVSATHPFLDPLSRQRIRNKVFQHAIYEANNTNTFKKPTNIIDNGRYVQIPIQAPV